MILKTHYYLKVAMGIHNYFKIITCLFYLYVMFWFVWLEKNSSLWSIFHTFSSLLRNLHPLDELVCFSYFLRPRQLWFSHHSFVHFFFIFS